ncbi:MAG TPA: hypothetical protein VGN26_02100 [Armatimonadota bacterium]|jgi:hypothetical protein
MVRAMLLLAFLTLTSPHLWAARVALPTTEKMGNYSLPVPPGASRNISFNIGKETLLNSPIGGDPKALKGIESLSLLVLRLPNPNTKPTSVLKWYDARLRAQGWPAKLSNAQAGPSETSAVYQKPKKALLILDVAKQKSGDWELQVVYVVGDINASDFGNTFGAAPRRPAQKRG